MQYDGFTSSSDGFIDDAHNARCPLLDLLPNLGDTDRRDGASRDIDERIEL